MADRCVRSVPEGRSGRRPALSWLPPWPPSPHNVGGLRSPNGRAADELAQDRPSGSSSAVGAFASRGTAPGRSAQRYPRKPDPSGSNSTVECNLPKVEVAGSSPVSRSPRRRSSKAVSSLALSGLCPPARRALFPSLALESRTRDPMPRGDQPGTAKGACHLGSGGLVAQGHDMKRIHDRKIGQALCHLKGQLASSPGAHLVIG